ncbi:MAG: ankyrin repeat domain-containing protein [bacterium]
MKILSKIFLGLLLVGMLDYDAYGMKRKERSCAEVSSEDESCLKSQHQNTDVEWERKPLYQAVLRGQKESVELLLAAREDFIRADKDRRTLLNLAISRGHESIANMLIKAYDLANKVCFIDVADHDGSTPLFLACEKGYKGMVGTLIRFHSNVNKANRYGTTPLHLACGRNGSLEMVEKLVAAGATIDARDETGCTPLLNAVASQKKDIVDFLLQNGANPNLTGGYGHSMLYIACALGCTEIANLLLRAGITVSDELKTELREMGFEIH